MISFLLMAGVGAVMFLGARSLDRAVVRHEPELSTFQPAIPMICFVAKSAGLMISLAGLSATAWAAWT